MIGKISKHLVVSLTISSLALATASTSVLNSKRIGRNSGWGSGSSWGPPTTTTQETTTLSPETTTGWSVETTTAGWPGKMAGGGWQGNLQTTSSPAPGWNPPQQSSGWPAPASSGEIGMDGQAAASGGGTAGANHGSVTIVTGDSSNLATLAVHTGSYGTIDIGSGVTQGSSEDSGNGSSVQVVEGHNNLDAGEYYEGHITGNTISLQNEGSSFVSGEGTIGLSGQTENNSTRP